MKQDLETLRAEIQDYLESRNFIVFHGHSRTSDRLSMVHWDCDRYPDFRQFLEAAKQAEVKMIVFHHRDLTADLIEETRERLESIEMPREEFATMDRRLREIQVYEGFTCALELSFDYEGRIYIYILRTEWYEELLDIAEEIDESLADELDEEDEDTEMGGYFSRN